MCLSLTRPDYYAPQYKLHSYFMTCLLLQKMMVTLYKKGQLV